MYSINPIGKITDKLTLLNPFASKTSKGKAMVNEAGTPVGLPLTNKTSTKTSTKNSTNVSGLNNDYTSAVNDYASGLVSSSYSGGTPGYGGYYTLDIGGMLRAYEQEAEANRNVAKQTYDTTRNDLLTSLKRFQEENAKNVQNQQKAYLANQAALESARSEADRQTRIAAAARGLGGSGLQQLAQLQNLLSQGQQISDSATDNEQKMDALKTALLQYQEDTDNKLSNALNTYNNALTSINAALAKQKADAEVARANSYIPYHPGSGGSSSISAADAQDYGNSIAGELSTIVRNYQTAKKGTSNTTTYAQSLNALDALGLAQNGALYQQAKNNLAAIYRSKHNGKSPSY